ncbi:MAG: transporter [Sideroxydans sp.]|nr:transporter [Sideroxydans sp.]
MKSLLFTLAALLTAAPVSAAETSYPDLPPPAQVNAALDSNINVITAETNIKLEQSNQRKWQAGNHEFNLRAGSAQRNIANTGQRLKEWDVALERPIRMFGKSGLDDDIGAEGVIRAEYALGDARHEAGRTLLHLWFNWQREQAQTGQWLQQVDILRNQAAMTEKRLLAGDVPKMELNQAQAAVAQAEVSLQQARTRSALAAAELRRQFPALALPQHPGTTEPVPVEHDLDYWKTRFLDDNHQLGMAHAESRIQQLLAQRSRADRMPDPTVGVRYSSEMGGNEKVTGVYLSVPLSYGLRNATAEGANYQAEIAAEHETSIRQQLENDIYSTYTLATGSYAAWRQAHEAAISMRQNADLMTRAYGLGESGLPEVLNARRLALESALAETVAQFDANETHYRLLLDGHQLWSQEQPEAAP